RRIGPDPEREANDRGCHEPGAACEGPEGVAEVLEHTRARPTPEVLRWARAWKPGVRETMSPTRSPRRARRWRVRTMSHPLVTTRRAARPHTGASRRRAPRRWRCRWLTARRIPRTSCE